MNLGIYIPATPTRWSAACVNLPNGTGKNVRVAVFAKDAKAEEARKAGADIVGAEDRGRRCRGQARLRPRHRHTEHDARWSAAGKVLGPRNLMPNPKVGTVTPDVAGCGQGRQGRRRRVPRRKGGDHPGRRRQGVVHRGRAAREHQGVHRCGQPGQAAGAKGTYVKRVAVGFHQYGPRRARRPGVIERVTKFPGGCKPPSGRHEDAFWNISDGFDRQDARSRRSLRRRPVRDAGANPSGALNPEMACNRRGAYQIRSAARRVPSVRTRPVAATGHYAPDGRAG